MDFRWTVAFGGGVKETANFAQESSERLHSPLWLQTRARVERPGLEDLAEQDHGLTPDQGEEEPADYRRVEPVLIRLSWGANHSYAQYLS